MNQAQISGNLVKDVKTSKSQTGMAMAFFTVAVNSGYGDRKHTDFWECSLFGKRAEGGLIQYLTKGQSVIVTGSVTLSKREYEGKEYTNISLNASELDLIGSKPAGDNTQPQKPAADPFDDSSKLPF